MKDAAMDDDLTHLLDLAAERLGGQVLATNDDFFASKDNLLKASEPVFDPHRYTERGKWMDGWESRRRRSFGEGGDEYDWCLVRLGAPGVIRSAVVDTAHFKGNYPAACALEACSVDSYPSVEELLGADMTWTELLPRSPLRGDHRNRFTVDVPWRFTHVRLRIFPDGGVARLRLHGAAIPEPPPERREIDLAAAELGGRVIAASDLFFSDAGNLLLPDPATHMGDGWETRRRRTSGHDWALIRLAVEGEIEHVEIDTRHFRGNAPESCELQGARAPAGALPESESSDLDWREILPRTRLQPHTRHRFDSSAPGGLTHVRLRIYPDGGLARLRLYGHPTSNGRRALGVAWLNAQPSGTALRKLLACCGSHRWARDMTRRRPFRDMEHVVQAADEIWHELPVEDRLEAFAAHPRIGERKAARDTGHRAASWSGGEQAGIRGAEDDVLERLAEKNRAYEERFGFVFLICATGKSAAEMLAELNRRLRGDRDDEVEAASEEQRKILQLRLEKLLTPP